MKGEDLECECGAGAIDVAPDLTLNEMGAVSWHCSNGHLNISGTRPGRQGFQQARFDSESLQPAPTVK
jgi:hypothetical protein